MCQTFKPKYTKELTYAYNLFLFNKMATSTLDNLTYDLSNTLLADAVQHARQTQANKSKWANVVSQINTCSHYWNTTELDTETTKDIEEMYNTYKPEEFDTEDNFTALFTLYEHILYANDDWIN